MNVTVATSLCGTTLEMGAGPEHAGRRHGFATLRSLVTTWEERRRFRSDLERMAKDNPHLIGDIGLTGREVEAEIAKPFWQA